MVLGEGGRFLMSEVPLYPEQGKGSLALLQRGSEGLKAFSAAVNRLRVKREQLERFYGRLPSRTKAIIWRGCGYLASKGTYGRKVMRLPK